MVYQYLTAALVSVAFAHSAMAAGHSGGVDYQVGETSFRAVIKTPDTPAKARVYIIHDWNGLNDYEISRAEELAALGYEAVALDVFGTEAELNDMNDYRRETGALYQDRAEFQARISAAVSAASQAFGGESKEFLMGYCFGGAAVLEGARAGLDLDGFVSFHGGLGTPEGQDYQNAKGPILLLHGSADPVSGLADVAAALGQMQEAGVEHDARIYGGVRHSFTVPGSRDFDADADAQSWTALLEFLEENAL